ncbi:cytochrome P450 [Aspergillus carlsbadensis]|nr:cytochrome P450 [Aspergillus carlsbadensis]
MGMSWYFVNLCYTMHIPGPKLWIAFPILRHLSAIRGRLDIDMRHWHTLYGDAVRFGPDEVSFTTAQAWKDIYGHGHRQLPKVLNPTSNTSDIINANDADHTRLRRVLSHAFSAKGLQSQETLIMSYVDKLITRLKEVAETQSPTNMVQWYNLTTFDLIGDLAFGQSFNGLDNSRYHDWVATVFAAVKAIPFIKASEHYPLLFKVVLAFLPKSFLAARQKEVEHSEIMVQKRLNSQTRRDDFLGLILNHSKDGQFAHSELEANATILIIAGSETTATLLSGATYLLLKSPTVLEKATAEVRSAFKSEADLTFNNTAARLPYMNMCLTEALRLYPPAPGLLQRLTTESSTCISGYELPARTKVAGHQSAAYRAGLPEMRDDPSSPFYSDNREVLQPFSTGPRNCIGKNLAYNEMRMILAKVLWNFDLELCVESKEWWNQRAFELWEKPPLMCKLTRTYHKGKE